MMCLDVIAPVDMTNHVSLEGGAWIEAIMGLMFQ
jgi:hypothetical protein